MRKVLLLILALCFTVPTLAESYPTSTPPPAYTLRESADEVRVFATRSTKANIVGYIIPGSRQEVQVLSVTNDWCYVSFSSVYGTSYGYIPLSFFDKAVVPTPTPAPEVTWQAGTPAWVSNAHEGYRLNLRAEPAWTAASLGKYYTGTQVILTGNAEGGFLQVLLEGQLGWMDARYLTTDALTFVPETPMVTIASMNGGVLRAGPSADSARITRCSYGTPVTVLGVCANGWYHITTDEYTGYIAESVLSGTFPYGYGMDSDNPDQNPVITDQKSVFYTNTRSTNGVLNLRKSASSNARSLGKFYTGTPLTIISYTRTGWAYVRIGQTEGYMDTDYITPEKPKQSGSQRVIRNTRANGLNLRSIPSTGGEILAFLPNYTEVTVLGELSDGWCYIQYGEVFGYMLGTYLQTTK